MKLLWRRLKRTEVIQKHDLWIRHGSNYDPNEPESTSPASMSFAYGGEIGLTVHDTSTSSGQWWRINQLEHSYKLVNTLAKQKTTNENIPDTIQTE